MNRATLKLDLVLFLLASLAIEFTVQCRHSDDDDDRHRSCDEIRKCFHDCLSGCRLALNKLKTSSVKRDDVTPHPITLRRQLINKNNNYKHVSTLSKHVNQLAPPAPVKDEVNKEEDQLATIPVPEKSHEVKDIKVRLMMKNMCGKCNKRVGLLGYKCRCGLTFCGNHRYAELHGCTFDYKAIGKSVIAKANPVIKRDKLERF